MKKRAVITAIILMLVLVAAFFGYNSLSGKVQPQEEKPEVTSGPAYTPEPESVPEQAESENTQEEPQPEDAQEEPQPENTQEDVNPDAAPDFSVLDMDGNTVRLSDQLGKPVIINFWATWCGPCKAELPAFDEAYEICGDEITFMMVNLVDGDTPDGVRDFVEENGFAFPVYFDAAAEGARAYGIYAIPLTVFIDADGNEVGEQLGSMSESVLQGYIDVLLGK